MTLKHRVWSEFGNRPELKLDMKALLKLIPLVVILAATLFMNVAIASPELPFIHEQKFDLKNEQEVSSSEFKVTVPKSWSYSINQSQNPVMGSDKIKISMEILLTPTKNQAESKIYIGFHDAIPAALSIEKQFENHKADHAALSSETWNGVEWKILEYSRNSENVSLHQWFAVTHLKTKDLFISAGLPASEDAKYKDLVSKSIRSIKLKN